MKHVRKILILLLVSVLGSILFACVPEQPTEVAVNVDYAAVAKEVEFGTELDLTGLIVTADLSSGEFIYIPRGENGYSVNDGGYNCMKAGKYTITVTYKEFLPVVFDITVKEYVMEDDENANEIIGLSVDYRNGAKTIFWVGDEFAPGNLIVNKVYKNGDVVSIDSDEYEIDTTSFDSSAAGTYNILVSYISDGTQFETTYAVRVVERASV